MEPGETERCVSTGGQGTVQRILFCMTGRDGKHIIARMLTDFLVGKYVGSNMSIDFLLVTYLGFSM